MSTIKIRFCRSEKLVSKVIRWRTKSEWSHVSIDPCSITAEWYSTIPDKGVYTDNLSFKKSELVEIPVTDSQKIKIFDFIKQTFRSPYDYLGALGVGLGRDWQEPNHWFCSEWVAKALMEAEVIKIPIEWNRVTPGDLRRILANL